MEIKVDYRNGSLPHPTLFTPVFNDQQINDLLLMWGLGKKTISSLALQFEFFPLARFAGQYVGNKDNQHLTRINNWYIQTARSIFNLVIIHELRHMFWNITRPRIAPTHINKEGFISRFCTAEFCCDQTAVSKEEKDCMRAETKYGDFITASLLADHQIIPKLKFFS